MAYTQCFHPQRRLHTLPRLLLSAHFRLLQPTGRGVLKLPLIRLLDEGQGCRIDAAAMNGHGPGRAGFDPPLDLTRLGSAEI